jgi:hypothetical protein
MLAVHQKVGLIIILTFIIYILFQILIEKSSTKKTAESYSGGSCLVAAVIATSLILIIP